MSAPLVPSPLDYIGRRRFAFYPPIRLPDPNEWMLGTGDRSEVQVVNAHTGREMWIPRQYIGAVSDSNNRLLVVGLRKALDLNQGTLAPAVKGVIEMPLAGEVSQQRPVLAKRQRGPATVTGIRLEPPAESSVNRLLVLLCIGALVVALLAATIASTIHLW